MDQLVDDILVEVLKSLSVTDLLTCRLVCKRLGRLALHPDVWRCKSVVSEWQSCPVLRLAPCLDSLGLNSLEGSLCFGTPCTRAYTTRCATRRLVLLLMGSSPDTVLGALLVIKQQAALGRLKALELRFRSPTPLTPYYARLVLEAIASIAGLEDLKIHRIIYAESIFPDLPSNCPFENALSSSIRHLSSTEVNPLRFIIAGYGATLESVGYFPSSMASELHLLTGLPKLTALHCALLPGMEALAACRSLTKLTLTIEQESEASAAVQGASALLREAGQLRHVRLEYTKEASSMAVAAKLLRALGASGQSSVHTLSIECSTNELDVTDSRLPLNMELLIAVCRLPALRELYLDFVLDELLRIVSPTTAPALRMLRFKAKCAHTWLHSDTAKTIPPSLHVRFDSCRGCPLDYCLACDDLCHKDVRFAEFVCFYSHPDGQCPSPDLHILPQNYRSAFVATSDI